MGNSIILLGVFLVVVGILIHVLPKGGIPLMPGDLFVQKENMTFYFPIVTSIVISIILTILLNIFK